MNVFEFSKERRQQTFNILRHVMVLIY